jgi:hypothetical protein
MSRWENEKPGRAWRVVRELDTENDNSEMHFSVLVVEEA